MTKKEKIIKHAEAIKLKENSIALLTQMIDDAKDSQICNFFSSAKDQYIRKLFRSSLSDFYDAYMDLLANDFVKHNSDTDTLIIPALLRYHFNEMVCKRKLKKRAYRKDPVQEQQTFLGSITTGKIGQIMAADFIKGSPEQENAPVCYNTKSNGIKIPENLMPYLTGKPLTSEESTYLMKYNPKMLTIEDDRRNLTKEEKRTFCACMAFFDSDGVIEDFNVHSLVKSIWTEFGDDSFVIPTVYLAIERLKKLKLIEEYRNPEKGWSCLRSLEYRAGFKELNKRYVYIPNVVLRKAFKKLQASSVKYFFDFLFRLNNGDDIKDGVIIHSGQDKFIVQQVAVDRNHTIEEKKEFRSNLFCWLHKRYKGEVDTLIYGNLTDMDFIALAEFFHFKYISKTVLQIRVRKQYYISKQAEELKKQLAVHKKYRYKLGMIKDYFKEKEISCSDEDLISILNIFKRVSRKEILRILEIFNQRLKEGKEKDLGKIRSLPAYIRTLYKNHGRDPDQQPGRSEIKTS